MLGLVLWLIILGTISRYYCAHSITPCLNFDKVTDDFSKSHYPLVVLPRRYVTKKKRYMYQNYMDDLSQFCLVLGRFVTKLFWDIVH